MNDKRKQDSDLRDQDKAVEERPVPSQAEGDLETIEEDLKQKEEEGRQESSSSGKRES
jgi:hypothetical protein